MTTKPPTRPKRTSIGTVLIASFQMLLIAGVVSRIFAEENSAYRSVFAKCPEPLPRYEQIDAPLMGNGDMAAALCGSPENQQFWLSKNDLWELRPVWCMSGPRPFGHLDIQMPQLAGATYHAEQDLREAITISTFKTAKSSVTMRSWVSATENLLVVELNCKGAPVEGDIHLWIPALARTTPQSDHRPKHGIANDWDDAPTAPVLDNGAGTFWGVRALSHTVAIPAAAVCAFRLEGAKTEHFKLRQGQPVTVIATMRSLRQSRNYISEATHRISSLDKSALSTLWP